jgi:hypothetical protein
VLGKGAEKRPRPLERFFGPDGTLERRGIHQYGIAHDRRHEHVVDGEPHLLVRSQPLFARVEE